MKKNLLFMAEWQILLKTFHHGKGSGRGNHCLRHLHGNFERLHQKILPSANHPQSWLFRRLVDLKKKDKKIKDRVLRL